MSLAASRTNDSTSRTVGFFNIPYTVYMGYSKYHCTGASLPLGLSSSGLLASAPLNPKGSLSSHFSCLSAFFCFNAYLSFYLQGMPQKVTRFFLHFLFFSSSLQAGGYGYFICSWQGSAGLVPGYDLSIVYVSASWHFFSSPVSTFHFLLDWLCSVQYPESYVSVCTPYVS